MNTFNVNLAGVPFEVRCKFKRNKDFFNEYFTDEQPLFTIEPREEDIKRMQQDFVRLDEASSVPIHKREDWFIENNSIHSLIADKLFEYDVILIHGSALCMDCNAYLFLAKSGTGKSTHSRLWREAFGEKVWMINDDKPLIRLINNEFVVYGTPWNGKHHLSRNASAPLKAIVQLERDTINHIEKIGKTEAFTVLMKQSYVSSNTERMMHVMEIEKKLLNIVDFYKLGCNMEKEAAIVAYNGMNS